MTLILMWFVIVSHIYLLEIILFGDTIMILDLVLKDLVLCLLDINAADYLDIKLVVDTLTALCFN